MSPEPGPGPASTTVERRFEALAGAPLQPLRDLADEILATGVTAEVTNPVTAAVAPLRLPVPDGGSFIVGHLVLTTCALTIAGVRGDGSRPGRDPDGAVAAAVCDAEVERDGPLAGRVLELIHDVSVAEATDARITDDIVAATRMGCIE